MLVIDWSWGVPGPPGTPTGRTRPGHHVLPGTVFTSTREREPGWRIPPTEQPFRRAIRPPPSMCGACSGVIGENVGLEWTFHQTTRRRASLMCREEDLRRLPPLVHAGELGGVGKEIVQGRVLLEVRPM